MLIILCDCLFFVELLSGEVEKIFGNFFDFKINISFISKDLSWYFGSICYGNK